jgi:hypothetical protein
MRPRLIAALIVACVPLLQYPMLRATGTATATATTRATPVPR